MSCARPAEFAPARSPELTLTAREIAEAFQLYGGARILQPGDITLATRCLGVESIDTCIQGARFPRRYAVPDLHALLLELQRIVDQRITLATPGTTRAIPIPTLQPLTPSHMRSEHHDR